MPQPEPRGNRTPSIDCTVPLRRPIHSRTTPCGFHRLGRGGYVVAPPPGVRRYTLRRSPTADASARHNRMPNQDWLACRWPSDDSCRLTHRRSPTAMGSPGWGSRGPGDGRGHLHHAPAAGLLAEPMPTLRPLELTFARTRCSCSSRSRGAGSLPLGIIGERLQVNPASVTNAVDRLEAQGLVERRPNPQDGRGTLAALTGPGRQLAQRATELMNARGLRRRRARPAGLRDSVRRPEPAAAGGRGLRLTSTDLFDVEVSMGAMADRAAWQEAFDRAPQRPARFETMSGVPLEPVYGPDEAELPGAVAVHPGAVRLHVPLPALDHAPVRRLRHRRRTPTVASRSCCAQGATASPPPLTCRPCSDATPMIPWPRERWVGPASPSTRWPTWRRSSRTSTWAR